MTSEPADTCPDFHLDYYLTGTGPVKHAIYSPDEGRLDIGNGLSIYVNPDLIEKLIIKLFDMRAEMASQAILPDPVPAL